jgi:NAD(P)-dependent dehydrogenase (short-subunit alcohol dehydrogenase family)
MSSFDLSGRSALVTGASRGLGLKIAETFARAGADLYLCARGDEALSQALLRLEKLKISPGQKILSETADVSKPEEASRLVKNCLAAFPGLLILVSNAGVYGPKGRLEEIDFKEFREALEINLMGPVTLARELLPHFRKQGRGKIIQISGGGATSPLPRLESYAASKAAVVRFMESLALDLAEHGVDVNCVAPGLMDTGMLDEILQAGPDRTGESYYRRMKEAREKGLTTDPQVGADLCLFLASSASDGISGRLVSAVWDDYREWPEHLEELKMSDVYTLRRITGRERGFSWGDK